MIQSVAELRVHATTVCLQPVSDHRVVEDAVEVLLLQQVPQLEHHLPLVEGFAHLLALEERGKNLRRVETLLRFTLGGLYALHAIEHQN